DIINYNAFGTITLEVNPALGGVLKYTAREYDAATGLVYDRARYYDPATGRFTTQDPAASDINLYRYVGNDATNRGEPSGLQDTTAEKMRMERYLETIHDPVAREAYRKSLTPWRSNWSTQRSYPDASAETAGEDIGDTLKDGMQRVNRAFAG